MQKEKHCDVVQRPFPGAKEPGRDQAPLCAWLCLLRLRRKCLPCRYSLHLLKNDPQSSENYCNNWLLIYWLCPTLASNFIYWRVFHRLLQEQTYHFFLLHNPTTYYICLRVNQLVSLMVTKTFCFFYGGVYVNVPASMLRLIITPVHSRARNSITHNAAWLVNQWDGWMVCD